MAKVMAAKKAPAKMAAKKMAAKKKTVSKVGKKFLVFRGSKAKTVGGLTKADLVKSKTGKIVSKKASLRAKKAFAGSALAKWVKATQAARKQLKITGFVAIKKGTPVYNLAKKLMA